MSRCSKSPCGAVRIQLLGGFRVEADERVIDDCEWRLQKARGLVKLLALAPKHRVGRDELVDCLWPEIEPEAGKNNLYYALHVARSALDRGAFSQSAHSSALQLAAGVMTLAPSRSVTVDVEVFRAAATAALHSADPRAYAAALDHSAC